MAEVNCKMNLNAVLIGMGMMGSNHARILSSLENVTLTGIVDSAINLKQSYCPVFSSIHELPLEKIDYCVIATPTITHEEIASFFLSKKIPVLIEKPIAHESNAAMRIVELADKMKLSCGVGHIERYNAAVQEAKRHLEANFLGKVYQISTLRQGPFPARISDVGVIKDLATHDIDTTRWLLDSNYDHISSNVSHIAGRNYEDLLITSGRMKNGVIVNHVVNWVSPLKERKTVITGEKGTLVVDTITSDLTYYENGTQIVSNEFLAKFIGISQGNVTSFAFSKPEALLTEHESYRNFLMGKPNNTVTLSEGLENLRVAEAMLKSAETRSVVSL